MGICLQNFRAAFRVASSVNSIGNVRGDVTKWEIIIIAQDLLDHTIQYLYMISNQNKPGEKISVTILVRGT